MTDESGTTGKGLETMKRSEATASPTTGDVRTSTKSVVELKVEEVPPKAGPITTKTTTKMAPTMVVNGTKRKASRDDEKRPSTAPTKHKSGGNGPRQDGGKIEASPSSSPSKVTASSKIHSKVHTTGAIKSATKPISQASTSLLKRKNDGGNDRVTFDKKPNQPLVPESGSISNVRNQGNKGTAPLNPPIVSTQKKSKASPSSAAIHQQKPSTATPSSLSSPDPHKKSIVATSSNSTSKLQTASIPVSNVNEPMISLGDVELVRRSLGDEELVRQRAPLTSKYSPYVIHSDTSLADARRRLEIALDQTRQLRAAFTERVYGKYRVCLQPPPQTQDIIKALKDDPVDMHKKIELELKRITDEKGAEKKDSQQANISCEAVAARPPLIQSQSDPTVPNIVGGSSTNGNVGSSAASSADSAEQFMYVTSGLSLIILPEDDTSNINVSMYRERSPVNPQTGQRVRGISPAAATSGKLMLERARQGKVARAERMKRLQQKANNLAHNFFDSYYKSSVSQLNTAEIEVPTAAPKTLKPAAAATTAKSAPSVAQKTKSKISASRSRSSSKSIEGKKVSGAKRPAAPKPATKVPAGQTAAGAKAIRARVQTPMTLQTLLNLNPVHEELRTDTKYCAATLAMMECGVGTYQGPTTQYHKNTPHRFKHPFPDSLGGRRRPVTSAGGVVDASNATNLQLTLPPIPSVRERRRYQKIAVKSRKQAGTTRAELSIRKILDQFTPSANKAAVAIESDETQENPLLCRPKKQRKISEIGFVRGLYLDSLDEGRARAGTAKTEAKTNQTTGIDSTLTLNVLKAVGLIKSSVSNDSKSERSSFQTSLASSLFKEIPSTGAGPYGDSISTLKGLEQKLLSQTQSFTASFCSDTEALDTEHEFKAEHTGVQNDGRSEVSPKISAPLAIRGGGSGSSSDVKEKVKSPERKPTSGGSTTKHSKAGKSLKRKSTAPKKPTISAAATQANLMHQNVFEERLQQQRLASLQAQGMAQQHSAQLQAQLQNADHFRQTNALQLAHQLRLSRMQAHGHPGAGDLADYLGGLHQSTQAQAAYGWAPASAAAVAVANSNNLAALGLNPNGVMPLSVEDRTRVLFAREHQNLAARVAAAQRQQQALLMRGMAAVENQFAQSGYPHISGQLLNPAAAALMAHQGMQNRVLNASPKKANPDSNSLSQKAKFESKGSQKDAVIERDSLKPGNSDKIEKKAQKSDNSNNESKANVKQGDASESNGSAKKKRKILPNKGNANNKPEKRKRTYSVGKIDDRSNEPSSAPAVPKSPSTSMKFKSSENKTSSTTHEVSVPKTIGANEVEATSSLGGKEDQPPVTIGTDIQGDHENNVLKAPTGLQYYVPEAPPGISTDFATTVLAGRCHEAIGVSVYRDLACEGLRVVNYITSVGMAVPIPKTVVMNPLKDRMNGLVFKNSNVSSMPASSREIIAAVILLWLWRNQEGCFQRAFAKSGRIDVDPECKWFVNAAINKAVTALSNEVIGSTSRANGLTTALLAHKTKTSTGLKCTHGKAEQESLKTTTTKIDLLAASVVSKSLNMTLVLNEEMNSAIPQFNNLVDYLDECRKLALFAKSQERALLAAVVSRKATMSLSFSHSYVSAIVRAGEALGHGALFEVVQNEKCGVSTMIPYDVFTDESGAWEDPCRPATGFNEGLTGDDLLRRAHTRAIIHKSLKKLQDRQNVKGGTQTIGPYVDQNSAATNLSGTKGSSGGPRNASNRRRLSEPSIQPGSGSAAATGWALYTPNHQSPPLDWDVNATDNAPYGRYDESTRPRSLSLAQGVALLRNSGRGQRRRRSSSTGPASVQKVKGSLKKSSSKKEVNTQNLEDRRSTREIPWEDVAGIFQKVELPDSMKRQKEKEGKMSSKERTIFAPIVTMPDSIPVVNEDESDSEENLSDEAILENHRVVLDKMKARLSSYMESKKRTNQDRRKSRDKSSK